MQKLNCAIYVRKSNEKGLEMEFNSLQNQEESCKNYILSQTFNGWEYYKTYTDGGISGGTMKRPALVEMMEEVKKGNIQVVVSYKLDRLSRSIIDFHNMMKIFDKNNCSFVSITQAFDTSTSMGKLTLNMLLSFAQFEREVSGERIRDKIAATKAKGLWVGGCPPLGYDVVDKKLVVNEKEAEDVRFIFKQYLKEGSIRNLREFLKCAGFRTKEWKHRNGRVRGGEVYVSAMLARILRSQVYIGRVEYKREGKSYPGQHEAIIDRKLFDRVQRLLDANRNNNSEAYEKGAYLLSGKIFDHNGNVFKNQKTSKNGTTKYRYYALKGNYLPAGDVDEISVKLIEKLFDCYLSDVLDESKLLEFKSVAFESLKLPEQEQLLKSMVEKIIYDGTVLTYFINIENLACLRPFRRDNYKNIKNFEPDFKIYPGNDGRFLVIEKEISINNRHLTNKYIGRGRKIIDRTENSNNLIKALSTGWRYGKMFSRGMGIREIMKSEKIADRTIYKYMNLNLLSPRIVNGIMAGQIPGHINLQTLFEIAGKYADFKEQENAFNGSSLY